MISSIYTSIKSKVPLEIENRLRHKIENMLEEQSEIKLFFRADDIAVPSNNFSKMMALFQKYELPLCLAVVPVWMTRARWETMGEYNDQGDLFCWHMHGYQHLNHENRGKKQEFGPSRLSKDLHHELSKGCDRLKSILGNQFTPFFTPPWNRCSMETMQVLKNLGFKGISRSHGSDPDPPYGLEEFPIHVDLHTRKEKEPDKGWDNLFLEFNTGLNSSSCGIMIHHMRMNSSAFIFLEFLLKCLRSYHQIKFVTFSDLI